MGGQVQRVLGVVEGGVLRVRGVKGVRESGEQLVAFD